MRSPVSWLLPLVLLVGCSKKEIGEPCEEGRDCESDLCLVTQSSESRRWTCTKLCESESDCPDGGKCFGGSCEAACDSQADCPDETVCYQGLCAVECRSDDDCVNAICPAPGDVCEPK